MKFLFGLALAAALSCSALAHAGDNHPKAQKQTKRSLPAEEIKVGSGLICDTKQQAERFVSLLGDNIDHALLAVNDEVGQRDACVVAIIGFFPGQKVAEIEKNGAIVNVIEVLVLAVGTPRGLRIIEPKMYYSVVQTKDRIT